MSDIKSVDCSVAQAVSQVGDPWCLLILREAFNGISDFEDFRRRTGVATNVLSDRLRSMVESGIMDKTYAPHDARRSIYRLTAKEFDLYPLIIFLAQWGERWMPNGRGERVRFIEEKTGEAIAPVAVTSKYGRVLNPRDVIRELGSYVEEDQARFTSRR